MHLKINIKKIVYLFSMASFSITLSSCEIKDSMNVNTNEYNYEEYVIEKNPVSNITNTFTMTMDDQTYHDYMNYLDTIEITFPYENYYDSNSINDKINNLDMNIGSVSPISIDGNTIYKIVKENNKNYNKSIYEELDDETLKKYCNILSDTINYYWDSKYINHDAIYQKLNTLQILTGEGFFFNGSYNENNILVVNKEYITFSNTQGSLEDVVAHESIHFIQSASPQVYDKNDSLTYGYGFSYKFKDELVNSRNFQWFYEASAEKASSISNNTEINDYPSMIGYLDSLELCALLNDNYMVNDMMQLSFTSDINDLYNAMNINNKAEFLNMLYNIEIAQNKPLDIRMECYNNGEPMDENNVGYEIKSSTLIAISKLFYQNLASAVKNHNIGLNDIAYLITVFETKMGYHSYYYDYNYYDYNILFISNYTSIQDAFFKSIANSGTYSYDEIVLYFENYSPLAIKNGNNVNNYDLNWLDSSKVNLLENTMSKYEDYYNACIRKYNKNLIISR